jgi:hypothetical protein
LMPTACTISIDTIGLCSVGSPNHWRIPMCCEEIQRLSIGESILARDGHFVGRRFLAYSGFLDAGHRGGCDGCHRSCDGG